MRFRCGLFSHPTASTSELPFLRVFSRTDQLGVPLQKSLGLQKILVLLAQDRLAGPRVLHACGGTRRELNGSDQAVPGGEHQLERPAKPYLALMT